MFTICQTSFPMLQEIAHPFLPYAYIAAQATFTDIVFGHMLLFLAPLSKCSANILLLSWNIAVWSHSLSVHQLLRKICAWSKGTNWPKSDWCLWYCSEQNVIPTRKNRKAWLHLAELHHKFPLLSAEEIHRILSQEEHISQLNIYFDKQRKGFKHNICCLLGQDTSSQLPIHFVQYSQHPWKPCYDTRISCWDVPPIFLEIRAQTCGYACTTICLQKKKKKQT